MIVATNRTKTFPPPPNKKKKFLTNRIRIKVSGTSLSTRTKLPGATTTIALPIKNPITIGITLPLNNFGFLI